MRLLLAYNYMTCAIQWSLKWFSKRLQTVSLKRNKIAIAKVSGMLVVKRTHFVKKIVKLCAEILRYDFAVDMRAFTFRSRTDYKILIMIRLFKESFESSQ